MLEVGIYTGPVLAALSVRLTVAFIYGDGSPVYQDEIVVKRGDNVFAVAEIG